MTTIDDIMKKRLTLESIAEGLGIALGVAVVASITIIGRAWVIHFILSMAFIGNLTYWQILGLLAIWELIKPASSSK